MDCAPKKHIFHGHAGGGECCGPGFCGPHPQFMSKKKKIEMLRKHIDMLKEKIEDIEEYIKEISGK